MKKHLRSMLCAVLSGALLLTGCGSTSDFTEEAVLKIDGQEIMKSEYMVHLYTTSMELVSAGGEDVWNMDFEGQTADELVEEHTIRTLQGLVAAKKYAAENGITLTEEKKAEAKTSAEAFLSSVAKEDLNKMGMDQEKMTAVMEDSYLYAEVYQAVSEGYEVPEAEIDAFFTENKDGLMEKFQLLKVNSIVVDDQKAAEEVMEKATAGEDFSALFATYDTIGDVEGQGENGEMTVYRYVLEGQYGLSPDAAVGDVEGPFNMGSTYFILKVAEEIAPDEAEVKRLAGETYRSNMQMLHAEDTMEALANALSAEKIEGVWESLENFH